VLKNSNNKGTWMPLASDPIQTGQERLEAVGNGQNGLSRQTAFVHRSGRLRSGAASSGTDGATQNATWPLLTDPALEAIVNPNLAGFLIGFVA
jgi:hypothetical protein